MLPVGTGTNHRCSSGHEFEQFKSHRAFLVLFVILSLVTVILISIPSNGSGESRESSEYTTLAFPTISPSNFDQNVTLKIRFFHLDSPLDADEINISIGAPDNERYIEVDPITSRLDTGFYSIEFKITSDDLNNVTGVIPGTAVCSIDDGRSVIEDTADFMIIVEDSWTVIARTENFHFQPGEIVNFTITTVYDGHILKPQMIEAFLTVNGVRGSVTLETMGGGMFWYEYQDPDDGVGKDLLFEVNVTDWNRSYIAQVPAVLQLIHLWMDTESIDEDSITGSFGVVSPTGTPLEAEIEYTFDFTSGAGEENIRSGTVSSDGTGLAVFDLDISDISQRTDEIPISFWVNTSDNRGSEVSQYIQYALPYRSTSPVPDELFEVVYKRDQLQLPLGEMAQLDFAGFGDGIPLAESELIYFITTFPLIPEEGFDGLWSDHNASFIRSGTIMTDGSGSFSLNTTTPDTPSRIGFLFKVDTGDTRYGEGDWLEFRLDPIPVGYPITLGQDMNISVENFTIGGVADISVTHSGHENGWGWLSLVSFSPEISEEWANGAILGDPFIGWHHIEPTSNRMYGPYSGSEFSGSLTVPGFLPEDTTFLIRSDSYWPWAMDTPLLRDFIFVNNTGETFDPFEIELSMTVELPDTLTAGEIWPIRITFEANASLSGIDVTLESTENLKTCKSHDTTDEFGEVDCLLQSTNMSGENQTGIVWINATKEGYSTVLYSKEIAIVIWVPLKEMIITTDLPDVVDSAETRPMKFLVTSEGEPVPGVRVTIEPVGSADSCKVAGTTDENGEIHCTLFVYNVISSNSSVLLYLNGTKAGYAPHNYTKFIIVKSVNSPDELLDPIQLDLSDGSRATIIGSYVGNVSLQVTEVPNPGQNDPYALGVYFGLVSDGDGTFRWINITISNYVLPSGFGEEKMRIFSRDTFTDGWKLARQTGVDIENHSIYANVTRIGIFAARELEDVTPPDIDHKHVKRADPDKNITISAEITDEGNGVSIATLYYRMEGRSVYNIKTMVADGSIYSAVIPARDVKLGVTIEYYIRVSDGLNAATDPEESNSPHRIEVKEKDDTTSISGPMVLVSLTILGVASILVFLYWRNHSD